MKKQALMTLLLASCALGLANNTNLETHKEVLDTNIIVQLKGDTAFMSEQDVVKSQNKVLGEIRKITNDYEISSRFTNVANAISLKLNSKYVDDIRLLPDVIRVDYNKIHSPTYNASEVIKIKKSVTVKQETENVSATTMNKPENSKEGEGTLVAILDTGFMLDGFYTDENDVLHEHVMHETFTPLAKGVKVHDTKESISYKASKYASFHAKESKGHSVYFNSKVPFYYDYGGETNIEGTVGPEDYDVFAPGQDHGNHVASIVAGNSATYKGIAPKAQLALMKVFTCYTPTDEDKLNGLTDSCGAYDEAILKALEDCSILGVDVINMSLGNMLNDFDEDSIVNYVFETLNSRGIYSNIAAGNEGTNQFEGSAYEFWSPSAVETGCLGTYAAVENATQVAAAQADKEYYETAFIVGNKTVSFYDQITNYNSTDGEVVYEPERRFEELLTTHPTGEFEFVKVPGWGEAADYTGLDVTGRIAIIDRGETTFVEKITNAQNKGAIAVGIIDNDPTKTDFDFRMDLSGWTPNVPVVSILHKDRELFCVEGPTPCTLLSQVVAANPSARTMTTFSSDGPTWDLRIKPEISAPGQSILGAVFDSDKSYEYYNGTSMATPNYCGAMALVISEHLNDATWKASVNARLMSTANPMKDKFGVNYDSVRRQGAGMVDISGAISSNIYLDGTKNETLTGKAKVELLNNADIKAGNVKLSFSAVSSEANDVSYTATTYYYRPELAELDVEQFPEFEGKKLQATYDHLIATKSQQVNVKANSTTLINLDDFQIAGDEKVAIDSYFENGTYIEGFTFLEAEGHETLVIPFLGFYGDYSKEIPVEPFSFEKRNDIAYGSDVLNSLIHKWAGLDNADYSSDWVLGYYESMEDISMENWVYNETNLRQMKDGNGNSLIPVGTNPITLEVSKDDIYFGNNNYANTMIISQFVNRSCTTNDVTITSKASGEVILRDHMFDEIYGDVVDSNDLGVKWPLYKSFANPDYWAANIIAHRAYTIIPLYRQDADGNNIGNYPDGEYEIKFSYTLASGGTYEKKYTFHIDSTLPMVSSVEDLEDTYRVHYVGNISGISVGSEAFNQPTKESNGYYVDIAKDSVTNSSFLVSAKTISYGQGLTYVDTTTGDRYSCVEFSPNTSIEKTLTPTKADPNELTLKLKVKKGDKSVTIKSDCSFTIKVPDGMNGSNISISFKQGNNKGICKVEVNNGYMSFHGPCNAEFTISDKPSKVVAEKITSISATATTQDFYVGDTFTSEGLLVWGTTNFGELTYVESTNVTVDSSAVDMSKAGKYEVTVKCGSISTTYEVNVYNKDVLRDFPTLEETPVYTPKKGGCKGSALASSLLISLLACAGISLLKRRKED